jgi:hypothetical protein
MVKAHEIHESETKHLFHYPEKFIPYKRRRKKKAHSWLVYEPMSSNAESGIVYFLDLIPDYQSITKPLIFLAIPINRFMIFITTFSMRVQIYSHPH